MENLITLDSIDHATGNPVINRFGCIEIPVSDMKRAIDFYENTLKLKKTYEHPVWTSFEVGGVSFALAASGTKKGGKGQDICTSCSMCVFRYAAAASVERDKEAPSASSVIYLAVEDVDQSYRQLKEQGVKFIAEPKDQGWGGRTTAMLDPDNNILVLTQVQF